MTRTLIAVLISSFLFFVFGGVVRANLPVKKTAKDICYPPEHPRYEKVKDYVKTYPTLDECLKSGGRTIKRIS